MSKMFGLARLGRDAEVRFTAGQNSTAVCNLSLAFTYRANGERLTQWVEGSLWGKQAEALAPYLLKGGLHGVALEDVHIQTFEKKDKTEGFKLVGRVSSIELGHTPEQEEAAAPPPPPARTASRTAAPAPARRTAAAPAPTHGFDDMDSDIPFVLSANEYSVAPLKARRLNSTRRAA